MEADGVDAIIFTAGLGENAAEAREAIVKKLSCLGITLNEEANQIRGEEVCISAPESKVSLYVVPTNEELMIAQDTVELIGE